jgi:cell wall-associated NlpC family hydrolase
MAQTHWTEAYLGIPYKIKGRNEAGLDCWGLVYLIYLEMFGISLPLYVDGYEDHKDLKGVEKVAVEGSMDPKTGWVSVIRGQETFGDVMLIPLAGMHTHVAMCIEPGIMIHALDGSEVSIEEYRTGKWFPRYNRCQIYRHPEVYA